MSQEGHLSRHNKCRFALDDLYGFFFAISQFFLTLLHPGQFPFGVPISLVGLLFLFFAQLGQISSLIDKTSFEELFALRHVAQECLAVLPCDVLNNLFSHKYSRTCTGFIGAGGKTDQRWGQISAATQQEQVFWRAHLNSTILPLLETN